MRFATIRPYILGFAIIVGLVQSVVATGVCRLGPLSLGMNQTDATLLLGAAGFPGLRDGLRNWIGRSYIDSSGKSLAGLVFERGTGKLLDIEVSVDPEEIEAITATAKSVKFLDWVSTLNFKDWSVSQGIRLGDSQQKVFQACGVDEIAKARAADNLVLVYQSGGEGTRVRKETGPSGFIHAYGQTYFIIRGRTHAMAHRLGIRFRGQTVVAISLTLDDESDRAGPL